MKVNGIIAEYNPFHNGHRYHLATAKEATGADYTIIAMSGNFMQRGTPALLDKFKRTEMALRNGADLVLELPMYYAASSAEYFAKGAVALLDKLGVVTNLCFGSECGDLEVLYKIAQIYVDEPEEFTNALRTNLRHGMSYPLARTSAFLQYEPSLSKYREVFSSPNNILGIEYLKALLMRSSQMQPHTTIRSGAAYHDNRIGNTHCSALAIRHAIFSREDTDYLADHMPETSYELIVSSLRNERPLHIDHFSSALLYKLLSESDKGFDQYLDVSSDLSDKIIKNLYHFDSFSGFCDLLKSKEMTYTRISRCLLHILLNMKQSTMESYSGMDYVPYARVLGFRKDATPLLSAIKEHSSIPLITKLADAGDILSEEALAMLKQDIQMNSIYESTAALKAKRPMRNEYRTPIVIV